MPQSRLAPYWAIFSITLATITVQANQNNSPPINNNSLNPLSIFSPLPDVSVPPEPHNPEASPLQEHPAQFQEYPPRSLSPKVGIGTGMFHQPGLSVSPDDAVPNIPPPISPNPSLLQISRDTLLIPPGSTYEQMDKIISKSPAKYVFSTQVPDIERVQEMAIKHNRVPIFTKTEYLKDGIITLNRISKKWQVTCVLNVPKTLSQAIAIHGISAVSRANMTEQTIRVQYQAALKQCHVLGFKILDLASQQFPKEVLDNYLKRAHEDEVIMFVSHIVDSAAILANGTTFDVSNSKTNGIFWIVGCNSASQVAFNNGFGGGVLGPISYKKAFLLIQSIGKSILQNSTKPFGECLLQVHKNPGAKGSTGLIANVLISQPLNEQSV